ncbi:hypothetical protein DL96DRAFT_1464036 [Flagelloscypha sp. PMI_526]|nr:hypothetical protein DL96DRAFT_1464036 [Flagelloscypha sp. PMI_526]
MPGPGQKTKKKRATKILPHPDVPRPSYFGDIENSDSWDFMATTLCQNLQLDLETRHGLKRVHLKFDAICKELDSIYDANVNNVRITGAVVSVASKMCIDSILRTRLVQKGLLVKIIPLLTQDFSRHMALQCLVNITHHGGVEEKKVIAETCTSPLIQVIKDHFNDRKAVELAVITLGHSLHTVVDGTETGLETPYPHILRKLDMHDNLDTITRAIVTHGAQSPQLSVHGLELIAAATYNCKSEVLSIPDLIELLVSGLRSKDWTSRALCLGGIYRMYRKDEQPERLQLDPNKFAAALASTWPEASQRIVMKYGMQKCDFSITLQASMTFQRTMMKVAQDHDLVACGIHIAENILLTEFSIADGVWADEHGRPQDLGLGFIRYLDSLPVCAKAIRQTGRNLDSADILDMKYKIGKQDLSGAFRVAEAALKRNPQLAYAYYALSLSGVTAEGLKAAKKGIRCTQSSPFVRRQLLQRAAEHSCLLGIFSLQTLPPPGSTNWEEGIAFLMNAAEDAKMYLNEAPPDARQMAGHVRILLVLHIQLITTILIGGPETPKDLHDLKENIRRCQLSDEIAEHLGTKLPHPTAVRQVNDLIIKLYERAEQKFGRIIEILVREEDIPYKKPSDEAANDIASWLSRVEIEGTKGVLEGQWRGGATRSKVEPRTGMYRCSYCSNPSAALKKCSGCSQTRYCDANCQKQHWSEHKKTCASKSK